MRTLRRTLSNTLAAAALVASGSMAHAIVVHESFEGQTAGSGTVPSGWTLVTDAGAPTYVTSAAGAGSNAAGGSAGLAGQVSSTAFIATNHPGGYLVHNTVFDATKAARGYFDFYIPHEATFDDITFSFGDIGGGFDHVTAGQSLTFKVIEDSNQELIANGANAGLTGANEASMIDDTWFRARFTWTPTSGTTGNFSVTVEDFTANLFTRSVSGFTLASSAAQFGFGSVNDTIRFDNVNIADGPAVISSLHHIDTAASTVSTGSGKAVSFTMPAGGDMELTSIVLDLSGIGVGDAPRVELWSDDGTGTPIGSLLETLSNPGSLVNGFNEFAATLGTILEAGETYWVVVSAASGSFEWRGSSDVAAASDIGATHGGRLFGAAATPGTWTSTSSVLNLLQVNAVQVPTPAALPGALIAIGALAMRRGRRS